MSNAKNEPAGGSWLRRLSTKLGLGSASANESVAEPSTMEVEPTAADRAAILSTADFPWDYEFDPRRAELTKRRYADGTVGLEYEYADDDVELSGSIGVQRSERDAEETFREMIAHGQTGEIGASGATCEPRDGLYSWGDRSHAFVMRHEGTNIGFGVLAQRGDRIVSVSWLGFRVEDDGRRGLEALLDPLLERMASHELAAG